MFTAKVVLLGVILCCGLVAAAWKAGVRREAAQAACVALLAIHCMLLIQGDTGRRVLVGALGGIFGIKLAAQALAARAEEQEQAPLAGYLLQALIAFVLALPFVFACQAGAIGLLALFAGWLWLIALVLGSRKNADRQTWEWLVWFSLALLAFDAPWGWLGLASPALAPWRKRLG